MVMLDHLVEISPASASRFGVRIIHNTAINLLFVGCAATSGCLGFPANLVLGGVHGSTNRYVHQCNVCTSWYTVGVPELSGIYDKPANGRPLDRWVAGWLGVDTDEVDVFVKSVM